MLHFGFKIGIKAVLFLAFWVFFFNFFLRFVSFALSFYWLLIRVAKLLLSLAFWGFFLRFILDVSKSILIKVNFFTFLICLDGKNQ